MTLVFDQPNLPFPGGVLTPAVACGEALARRLIHSGVKFKMGEWCLGPYGWGPVWCVCNSSDLWIFDGFYHLKLLDSCMIQSFNPAELQTFECT